MCCVKKDSLGFYRKNLSRLSRKDIKITELEKIIDLDKRLIAYPNRPHPFGQPELNSFKIKSPTVTYEDCFDIIDKTETIKDVYSFIYNLRRGWSP